MTSSEQSVELPNWLERVRSLTIHFLTHKEIPNHFINSCCIKCPLSYYLCWLGSLYVFKIASFVQRRDFCVTYLPYFSIYLHPFSTPATFLLADERTQFLSLAPFFFVHREYFISFVYVVCLHFHKGVLMFTVGVFIHLNSSIIYLNQTYLWYKSFVKHLNHKTVDFTHSSFALSFLVHFTWHGGPTV